MSSNGNSHTSGDDVLNPSKSPWKSSASQASRDNGLETLSDRATVGTNSSHSTRCSQDFAETGSQDPASGDMLTYGIGTWTEAEKSHRAAAIDDVVEESHPAETVETVFNEPAAKGKVTDQSMNTVGEERGSNGHQKK